MCCMYSMYIGHVQGMYRTCQLHSIIIIIMAARIRFFIFIS